MDKIKIETLKPMKLAYIEHVGEYAKVPYDTYVPRLYEWAKENKVKPGFKNINFFYDDPQEKNPSECTSWIGIPVEGDADSDAEVKIKDFPEMKVATYHFKGPNTEFQEAYRLLGNWIDEHGYSWNGPGIEVCSEKPKIVNGEMIIRSTIHVPIKEK